ncbi:hypothetical protein A2215_04740 [Candidatus Berkelbacteria bacterium RIFOXYA2_FULL_43_10]|uniref:Uncharacterized protein n=1 Tax=Candidatus Berkelbacteria bacterium RIFOXYA2_FULL_43_10 TaxID=1797472 RepID=A0A1F5EEB1_9BACT|nr:MAG: hypothetical protein A2215_04740 [Candidatus Berkelbacteria bacterium RIFOXYA2_FULL_43_10]OGX61790.1 MAG: hypothetical protein A2189_08250 [Paenibacillus sp. RIFOXYA1_FULL_44_5]
MSKILFVKPAIEADAVWDPIRTCSYLGLWFMASLLKSAGHDVIYLDEVVRNGGLNRRTLFHRCVRDGVTTDTPLGTDAEKFQTRKMMDFHAMSSHEFVAKYSAFSVGGSSRTDDASRRHPGGGDAEHDRRDESRFRWDSPDRFGQLPPGYTAFESGQGELSPHESDHGRSAY